MLALTGILCFLTVPRLLAVNITAVNYDFGGPPPSLTGPLKQNFKLTKAERFHENQLIGPESFAFYKGHIYTGISDGRIVDISGRRVRTVANMGFPGCIGEQECGRPLGLTMDNSGRLIVADGPHGIVRVNVDTGEKELLFSSKTLINGQQSKLINHPAVAKDGTIFFTHSSVRWDGEEFFYILLEGEATGRLLAYSEQTNTTTVVLENLAFANGLAFGPNEEYLLIAESSRARIHKLSLKPGKTWMKLTTFTENLPGLPDNIRASGRGTFWVAMFVARHQNMSNLLDDLANQPERREMLARNYSMFQILAMIQKYGMLVEMNGNGEVVRTLQDPPGERIPSVTEAFEHRGCLYLGNVDQPYVSRLPLTRACHGSTSHGGQ